jgi:FdhE protein
MDTINYEPEALKEEIEKVLAEIPHIANLLKAFAPLLLERSRWLQEVQSYKKIFPVDAVQYLEGVPLIRQCRLFLQEDPWKSAGLSVAEAISKGFPQLSGEMAAISGQVADGTFAISTLVNSPDPFDDIAVPTQELGASVAGLQFFLRFLTRFILSKRSQDMATELNALSWKKGYCPVCGSFPHLAIIGDKGQKWLQCSNCSHEWQFPRLTCPYCNHEDPENTNIMYVEGKKEDSAFICSKCKRYLLTAHRADTLRRGRSDLISISLSHLDIILQGKGLRPMIECEWNTFS